MVGEVEGLVVSAGRFALLVNDAVVDEGGELAVLVVDGLWSARSRSS